MFAYVILSENQNPTVILFVQILSGLTVCNRDPNHSKLNLMAYLGTLGLVRSLEVLNESKEPAVRRCTCKSVPVCPLWPESVTSLSFLPPASPSTCCWGIYPPTLLANILGNIDSKTPQPFITVGRLELEGQSSTVSPVAGLLKNNI